MLLYQKQNKPVQNRPDKYTDIAIKKPESSCPFGRLYAQYVSHLRTDYSFRLNQYVYDDETDYL